MADSRFQRCADEIFVVAENQLTKADALGNKAVATITIQCPVPAGDLAIHLQGEWIINSIMRHVKQGPPAATDDGRRDQYKAVGQPAFFLDPQERDYCKPSHGKYDIR